MKRIGIVISALSLFVLGGNQTLTHAAAPLSVRAQIKRSGRVSGGAAYTALVRTKYGQLRKSRGNRISATASEGNQVVQVGNQPEGFGKGFLWDRRDEDILLAVFVNAADNLGVSIEGLKAGDRVQVTSATGISSFSRNTGNPTASSLVGLVATGAEAIAAAWAPAAIPFIEGAETFAKDQFKATNAKTKLRDSYGVEPGSGHKARQEGGLIVCLPGSGGPYYSGENESTDRWIKPDGTRDGTHMPSHIQFPYAYFVTRELDTREVLADGELYVLPWDWKFEDNAGYYKVFLRIKKGVATPPGPVLRTAPAPQGAAPL